MKLQVRVYTGVTCFFYADSSVANHYWDIKGTNCNHTQKHISIRGSRRPASCSVILFESAILVWSVICILLPQSGLSWIISPFEQHVHQTGKRPRQRVVSYVLCSQFWLVKQRSSPQERWVSRLRKVPYFFSSESKASAMREQRDRRSCM